MGGWEGEIINGRFLERVKIDLKDCFKQPKFSNLMPTKFQFRKIKFFFKTISQGTHLWLHK